jgi:hypothetical protein
MVDTPIPTPWIVPARMAGAGRVSTFAPNRLPLSARVADRGEDRGMGQAFGLPADLPHQPPSQQVPSLGQTGLVPD